MPRNKVDACIFCGAAPCECNKKPARPARPAPHPKVSKASPVVPVTPVVRQPVPRLQVTDEEILFNDAIRALAPLLADEEKERYAFILSSAPSSDEQRRAWKLRQAANRAERGELS